ncbi:hypothetical protein DERF_006910 [Dermatophagoides farinae]|uniref:Uncharacterized protein n=1 Tax=Dermatophagoides farinae TaxID=6954 RepID=A0A922HZG8_DERFA|nr:hypothetical protein DERF_006910 [Dermatophagoides farinae]
MCAQLRRAISSTYSLPMPVLPPVITITFPFSSVFSTHIPLVMRKYNLTATQTTINNMNEANKNMMMSTSF